MIPFPFPLTPKFRKIKKLAKSPFTSLRKWLFEKNKTITTDPLKKKKKTTKDKKIHVNNLRMLLYQIGLKVDEIIDHINGIAELEKMILAEIDIRQKEVLRLEKEIKDGDKKEREWNTREHREDRVYIDREIRNRTNADNQLDIKLSREIGRVETTLNRKINELSQRHDDDIQEQQTKFTSHAHNIRNLTNQQFWALTPVERAEMAQSAGMSQQEYSRTLYPYIRRNRRRTSTNRTSKPVQGYRRGGRTKPVVKRKMHDGGGVPHLHVKPYGPGSCISDRDCKENEICSNGYCKRIPPPDTEPWDSWTVDYTAKPSDDALKYCKDEVTMWKSIQGLPLKKVRDVLLNWIEKNRPCLGVKPPIVTPKQFHSGGMAHGHCDTICGDIDGNGVLNVMDVIVIIERVLHGDIMWEGVELSPTRFACADINGDGILNILDIVQMIDVILLLTPESENQECHKYNGCMDEDACNYDPLATVDDGSCDYPEENFDCDGNCTVDTDCAGECGGSAELDECGICNGDGADVQCWDGTIVCDDSDCPEEGCGFECCGIIGCNGVCYPEAVMITQVPSDGTYNAFGQCVGTTPGAPSYTGCSTMCETLNTPGGPLGNPPDLENFDWAMGDNPCTDYDCYSNDVTQSDESQYGMVISLPMGTSCQYEMDTGCFEKGGLV